MEYKSSQPESSIDNLDTTPYTVEDGFAYIAKGTPEIGMKILSDKSFDIEHQSNAFNEAFKTGLLHAIKIGNNNFHTFEAVTPIFYELVKTEEFKEAIQERVSMEAEKGRVRFLADNSNWIDAEDEGIKEALLKGMYTRINAAKNNHLLS